jgi:hypothetical protein
MKIYFRTSPLSEEAKNINKSWSQSQESLMKQEIELIIV